MTKERIIKKVKDEDVKFIRLQFTDIFGEMKNVARSRPASSRRH